MKGYVSSSSGCHAFLFRKRHELVTIRKGMKGERTHVWKIFTCMSTTRLFTGSSRGDGLNGALEDITQFKCLHKIPTSHPTQSELGTNGSRRRSSRVTNHTPVLDTDIIKAFIMERTFSTPSLRVFWVLKAATPVCIGFCMSGRILAVGSGPSERLIKPFVSYRSRSSQRKHT